ncbi:hypothetical protein PG997_010593 [Apiospora hydei]|uniref:DUF7791 domain-containing protein n=1 Tax=Apiospora hydei TaxID=1337664 RepID=A0ABR1VGM8_9PEZI
MLDGFTIHDSVKTLQKQLTSFPEDLEDFFGHMLKSIPSAYRDRAAATLKIATEADQPRFLMFYHFLDETIQDQAPRLDSSYTLLDFHSVASCCEKMRRQVNGRTKGLLEVATDGEVNWDDNDRLASFSGDAESHHSKIMTDFFRRTARVDFLHRTVWDFLGKSQKAKDFFDANMGSDIALSMASATAAVSQIKFAKFDDMERPYFHRLLRSYSSIPGMLLAGGNTGRG